MQAMLHLLMATARAASALQVTSDPTHQTPLLQQGLLGAAKCAACNHKDVSTNALSSLSVIIGKLPVYQLSCCKPVSVAVSTADSCPWYSADDQDSCAAANLPSAGGAIVLGLLEALLAVSPLARVHKVYSVMLSLACWQGLHSTQMLQRWIQNAWLEMSKGKH